MLQKRNIRKSEKPTQRDLQKIKTRERVYEAAKELFLTKGYSETRSGDIAKLAGVSHGSVFSHFQSKSEILEQLHNDFLTTQIQIIEKQSLEGIATKERLIFLLGLLWEDAQQNVKIGKVMQAQSWVWDEAREESYQKLTGRLRRIGEKILLEGQKKGEIATGLDVEAMMVTIQAQYRESLRMSYLGPGHVAPGWRHLTNLIDIICRF